MKYNYTVAMPCDACRKAIDKVLTRMDGIKRVCAAYNVGVIEITIDLATQSVLVEANADQGATFEAVKEKIQKTGRTVLDGKIVES